MSKFLLIIIFFLASCTSNKIKKDFIFFDEINFDEFKTKLENYANNNPYPNIDY